MFGVDLNNMDVNALLELRANVETMLAERGRDLQRQIALLGGERSHTRGEADWY